MVKSGMVISVDASQQCGVIQDDKKRQFFFSINECCDNRLPSVYTTVTFVKDPDFKSTNVAMLIKESKVFKSIA
jgi:hypothetical protein